MTYYQFRTTLLPSLPRKRMTTPNAVPMRKSKTLQSVLFFFSPLPFLKNWKKSLFFSTSTRLPNTYFLLCITKTSSIVYNHNTISLRKKKKTTIIKHLQKCVQSCQMATIRLREVPPERQHRTSCKALQRARQTLAGHLPKSRNRPAPGPHYHHCNKSSFSPPQIFKMCIWESWLQTLIFLALHSEGWRVHNERAQTGHSEGQIFSAHWPVWGTHHPKVPVKIMFWRPHKSLGSKWMNPHFPQLQDVSSPHLLSQQRTASAFLYTPAAVPAQCP